MTDNPMARYVSVYAPKPWPGESQKPAMVSWSSIGSVTPDQARQFAVAIIAAADDADRANSLAGTAPGATGETL